MITKIPVLSVIVAILAGAMMSCGGKHAAEIPPCEITAEMDSLLESVFPQGVAPGAVVGVIKDGEVKYMRPFGLANLRTGEPMTDNILINISGASKTFAVAGLMKLVEQGKLDLDTPLSTYFPKFNKAVFDSITFRNVLTHTTCLPDFRPRNSKQWESFIDRYPSIPFLDVSDFIRYGFDREMIAYYTDIDTLDGKPGTKFFYQDPPYMLISPVIEQVTGEDFEEWMQKNVFEPAGLKEARYTFGKMEGKGIAHAYKPKGHETPQEVFVSKDSLWEEFDYGEAPFFLSRVDKGIYITPMEYTTWLDALYGGKVVSLSSLDSMNLRRVEIPGRDIGYGYGSFVSGADGVKTPKIFHNNGNGGFTVFEAVFPEEKVAYFVFANYTGWNRLELSKKIDNILISHSWLKER